jgi:hypothetical protein
MNKQQPSHQVTHQETDFHHGEGHRVPLIILIAWTVLIIWALVYLFRYVFPNFYF